MEDREAAEAGLAYAVRDDVEAQLARRGRSSAANRRGVALVFAVGAANVVVAERSVRSARG